MNWKRACSARCGAPCRGCGTRGWSPARLSRAGCPDPSHPRAGPPPFTSPPPCSPPASREALPPPSPPCPPAAGLTCQEAADLLGDGGRAVHAEGGQGHPAGGARQLVLAPPEKKRKPRPPAATAQRRDTEAGLQATGRGFAAFSTTFPALSSPAHALITLPMFILAAGCPPRHAPATRDCFPCDRCQQPFCVRAPCRPVPLARIARIEHGAQR